MSIFDLLLILIVLATGVTFLVTIGSLLFRRWTFAGRLFASTLAVWAMYLAIGAAIAIFTPQRTLAVGEDRCFDEMCFTVTGFERTPTIESPGSVTRAHGVFLIVDARVSSRSHGRAQREVGRKGLVVDQTGKTYEVSPEGMATLARIEGPLPGLDAEVAPGQSVATKLVFDVPADILHPAFTLGTNLSVFPPRIIIANDEHYLHKPTVVPLN
jgi:hypothetical protein